MEAIINVVIPALDPLGAQRNSLIITLMSLYPLSCCSLIGQVVIVSDSSDNKCACASIFGEDDLPRWIEDLAVRFVRQEYLGHSRALNDGIAQVRAGHVLIMNPGDSLIASEAVIARLREIEPSEIIFCSVASDGYFIGELPPSATKYSLHKLFSDCGPGCLLYAPHQGAVMPLAIHLKWHLLYKESRELRMDFCLLSRLALLPQDFIVTIIQSPLAYYPPGGKSGLKSNRYLFYFEALAVLRETRLYRYAPRVLRDICAFSFLLLREKLSRSLFS